MVLKSFARVDSSVFILALVICLLIIHPSYLFSFNKYLVGVFSNTESVAESWPFSDKGTE